MKDYLRNCGAAIAGAALVAIAPTPANATDITNVQISEVEGGINILLDTSNGDRPEVFAVSRGNSYVADIINAQLTLAGGNNFREESPAPGIAYVEIMQIDANSVRVVIAGVEGPPQGRIIQGAGTGIILSAAPGGGVAQIPVEPAPTPGPPPREVTQLPAEIPPGMPESNGSPDVLLPDQGLRSNDSGSFPGQRPGANVPPFQPRAVAPPVGDIAISNINPGVEVINLNTGERIPRLVLREAPVRDVLALLARAAGLNIAYAAGEEGGEDGIKISLDIEDESVQDVFNYVLRLSALQANRVGNTIFVGADLPKEARNVMVRTFRLNQISARAAAGFLASMGAESATTVTRQVTEVSSVNIPGSNQAITNTQTVERTQFDTLRYEPQDSPALLRGMQVVVDTRLNSVTLVGPPNMVEIAASQLVQLDLRRRQVAVNVKIVDINLSSQDNFNSSFSFGINDTFFVNDNGAASLNFGNLQPPRQADLEGSFPLSRPIRVNPLGGEPRFDPDAPALEVPFTGLPGINGGRGSFIRPVAPVTDDPTAIGIEDFEPTDLSTFDREDPLATTFGDITVSLFPTILYPQRLLAQLQAQIVSGNGKILTDPTLVVQEGETATVNLTEDVVGNITSQTTTGDNPIITTTAEIEQAGLELGVNVLRIDDNGFITLTISPRVTSIAGQQSFDNNVIALLQERSFNSGNIRLRDGQTLIVSGIIQEQERTEVRKIPILGDLPIIGSLFRSTDKDSERAEVVVLVTPQIMDDSDRSNWGYQYNPSPDAMQMLDRGQPIRRR